MSEKWVALYAVIFSISIVFNIIYTIETHVSSKKFSGDVQACWDNGGDSFYADKKYNIVTCTESSKDIYIKVKR